MVVCHIHDTDRRERSHRDDNVDIEMKVKKNLQMALGNVLVMIVTLAGVLLADPWSQYRAGEIPVFVSPANWLELLFSIVTGLGVVYGVQELGGEPAGKHRRLVKRCIMAFVAGAGARVIIG